MNNLQLAIQFFLQLAVILACCRVVGLIAARFGQPQVVAEMIAGVLLGPSLFGWVFPGVQSWLFPWDPTQQGRDTQSYLFPASQLGLALYMFVVGMEFRTDVVKRHFKVSLTVSIAGMAVPFALGALLAWRWHGNDELALFGEDVPLSSAALFLGACLCITAFPMLARIIQFKGLTGTTMGTVAIGAGAIDDAMAWCLLAVVLASMDGAWTGALPNIGGAIGFVVVMLFVVRPILGCWKRLWIKNDSLTENGFVSALILVALSAWWTDLLHLHAVFGAFVAGAAMPRGVATRDLVARIQPLVVGLLLPLFFVYSGLNTRIGLLDSPALWGVCGVLLVVATVGKGAACYLAARAAGLPNREALGVGTLMNARGLMELIIINIGLQRGIISGGLFAALVLMAVVTTLIASPVFDWLLRGRSGIQDELRVRH